MEKLKAAYDKHDEAEKKSAISFELPNEIIKTATVSSGIVRYTFHLQPESKMERSTLAAGPPVNALAKRAMAQDSAV